MDYINNTKLSIEITREFEEKKKISFINVPNTRINNKHTFLIYHKPKYSYTTIYSKIAVRNGFYFKINYSLLKRKMYKNVINSVYPSFN